ESTLLERYALALQLVPDADVAGDLFMSSADERSLLARANRWRVGRGLPALTMPVERRPLSPVEAEHALHLARRAARRRRLHLGGAVLGVFALLAAALWVRPAPPVEGLAADPVFAIPALQRIPHPDGYQVWVHRVEAHPGSVTLWWSALGPGARHAATSLEPRLMLDSVAPEWLSPEETETAASRTNRVVGRSTFPTIITIEQEAWLTVGQPAGDRADLVLRLPLGRTADESARTVRLDQEIRQDMVTLRIDSVTLGRNYTQVRYASSTSIGRAPAPLTLRVGNARLTRKGPVVPVGNGMIEATFEALPHEVDRAYLTFSVVQYLLPPRSYPLPGTTEVYTRHGSVTTVVMALEDKSWAAAARGHFTGATGERYPATLSFQVEGNPARHRIMLRSEEIPADAELVSLTLEGLRQYISFHDIPLDLK
ncbi:MAG: hypothetical protein ACOY94_04930, partial [Bacillota bacterium]